MRSHLRQNHARRLASWTSLAAFFCLLSIPITAQLLGYGNPDATTENRVLAPVPRWPNNWSELLALPRQTDAWLRDHFGFRGFLVRSNSRLRYTLFHEAPTGRVLFGKENRLFLSGRDESHPYSIITYLCGINVTPAAVASAGVGVRTLLRAAVNDAPRALFVAVPSAPVLYAEDLPDWLARPCARPSTIERAMRQQSDDPEIAGRVIYPVQALIAAKQTGRVMPRYNFHWSGRGARAVAAMIAEQVLGLRRAITIPAFDEVAASDLSNMVPGLALSDHVIVPDYAAAGIVYCYARPQCLPELAPSIATTISNLSRIISPRAGTRHLLLVTDSYGSFIAPWFAAWFGEVRHVSTNTLDRLSADDRAALRDLLFHKFQPDDVVFLYHDGSVPNSPGQVAALLWPVPAVASAR